MQYLNFVNLSLATGGVILQALVVLLLILFFVTKENKLLDFVKKHFLWIGFIISFSGVLSSLFYSNVIGFIPCYLCWFQRIFMYPTALIFLVALIKKDRNVSSYILPLVSIGALFALYHNYIYYFGEGTAPCDASGVSCVKALVMEFGGYISIPSLSLTSFVALIVLLVVARSYKKEIA